VEERKGFFRGLEGFFLFLVWKRNFGEFGNLMISRFEVFWIFDKGLLGI
jgi:hypothetical protein